MSGSIKWMNYTADNGDLYAVLIDEDNGEAGGFLDYSGTADGVVMPKYYSMRYVNAISLTGVTRKFYVGVPDSPLLDGGGSITVGGVAYAISSKRGESRRLPRAADTGQQDGDAT